MPYGWDDGWEEASNTGDTFEEWMSEPADDLGGSWRAGRVVRGHDGNRWGDAEGRVPFDHTGGRSSSGWSPERAGMFDDLLESDEVRGSSHVPPSLSESLRHRPRPRKPLTAAQEAALARLDRRPKRTGLPGGCDSCGQPINSLGNCGCS